MLGESLNPFRFDVSRRHVLGGALGIGIVSTAAPWGLGSISPAYANLGFLNPGFEEIADGWPVHWSPQNPISREKITPVQDVVHGGDWAMHLLDDTDTGIGILSSPVPVSAGVTYDFGLHAFLVAGRCTLWVEFLNASGGRVSITHHHRFDTLGRWLSIAVDAKAPATATQARLVLLTDKNNRGSLYFDDAWYAEHAPLEPTETLLNPGFEEQVNGWPAHWSPQFPISREKISLVQDVVHGGAWAMHLRDDTDTGIGIKSHPVLVTEGVQYEFGIHGYLVEGACTLWVEFLDAKGTRISISDHRKFELLDTWLRVEVRAEAPAGATQARLLLLTDKVNKGSLYIDEAWFGAVEQRPVERFGPAALAAAIRGGTLIGNRLFVTSRFPVGDGLRLTEVDVTTGDVMVVEDLPIPSSGGQKLTTDGRYVYIGPAGSGWLWRYDPTSRGAERWLEVGASNMWTYAMEVDGDHLYLGTFPDCIVRRIHLTTKEVLTYGRVSAALYATAVAVDDQYVYGGSNAPGGLKRWPKEGGEAVDLTAQLSDSPVGIMTMLFHDGLLYVASGRQLISIRPDGSERVERTIPEEDRYVDGLTVGPDGHVYALTRLTTNVYRVEGAELVHVAQPHDDVENVFFGVSSEGQLVGVSGVGDVFTVSADGAEQVHSLASTEFAYPDRAQSMLLHSRGQRIWVGGHYSMTVHHVPSGSQTTFYAPGEAKALAEGRDGTVYAAMYPSATVWAFDHKTHEGRQIGAIGNAQMRPRAMAYDAENHQLVIATRGGLGLYEGALTFVDLATETFDVRANILPDQGVMGLALDGGRAYIVGDTYGEGTSSPLRESADVAAVDLRSHEVVWREALAPTWHSYETVIVQDDWLYVQGRRPRGHWFAYDLRTQQVVQRGDLGGYGGFGATRGRVYSWVYWTHELRRLPSHLHPGEELLYGPIPQGWYNNPIFTFTPNGKDTWAVWDTDLAKIPLID